MDDQREQTDSQDQLPKLEELEIVGLLSEKTAFANAMKRAVDRIKSDVNYAAHSSTP